jgi:hypothetical protein
MCSPSMLSHTIEALWFLHMRLLFSTLFEGCFRGRIYTQETASKKSTVKFSFGVGGGIHFGVKINPLQVFTSNLDWKFSSLTRSSG